MAYNLPLCYRFDPTDEELMLYLYNKVHGLALPSSAVFDCDLYGESQVWKKLFDETGEDILYFFTKLKKFGPSRIERATDSGTWRSQHETQVYMSSGGGNAQHLGYKRSFTFVPEKKDEEKARWVMHEYRLNEELLASSSSNPVDYQVVCRIKNESTRKQRRKRKWMGNDVTDNNSGVGEISEANARSVTSWGVEEFLATFDADANDSSDSNLSFTVEELEALMASDLANEQEK